MIEDKFYPNAKFERKPDGVIIVDGKEVAHTLQCCHCNAHFASVRGSGKKRGFCVRCHHVTCGKLECDVCIPFEEKLARMEG
jgi:hypothetical protein